MNTKDLSETLYELRNNPLAAIEVVSKAVRDFNNGEYGIPDPTNTFAFLMELQVACTNVLSINDEILSRKLYSSLAQTESDLFHHLSDRNMDSVFSLPSTGQFKFIYSKDEIIASAVSVNNQSGIRKISIPRDTVIRVGDVSFSLQYPIDIRVKSHDGVDVVYDAEIANPFKVLESNLLSYRTIRLEGSEFLEITADLLQYGTKIVEEPISNASGFNKDITFQDDFFSARVFHYISGEWREMVKTHSDLVYDPDQPTALLRVADNTLNVKIPPIYFSAGMIGTQIKILVHSTQGALNISLDDRSGEDISVEFNDYLKNTPSQFIAPLINIRESAYIPVGRTSGGRNKLGFKDLKSLTINNSFDVNDLPITRHQLVNKLNGLGFSVVKNIDNVTDRVYVATRSLPKAAELIPTVDSVVSNVEMGSTVGVLYTDLLTLSFLKTSKQTGNRLTLMPKTLYHLDNGILRVVLDSERELIDSYTPEDLINEISDKNYLFSPFYYVMDYNYNDFSVRSYHLDPLVSGRQFLDENDNAAFDIRTESYDFKVTDEGIEILIETSSKSSIDEIGIDNMEVQLAYTPFNESVRAFTKASYIGQNANGNHVFKFLLESDFDFDEFNNLYFTSFKIADATSRRYTPTPLITDFDIMYVVYGEELVDNKLNGFMAKFLVPESVDESYVAVREGVSIKLGDYLDSLWDKTRTIRSSSMYKKYDFDVYNYYEKDIYTIDPAVGSRRELVHAKGDPVMIDGEHQILHRKGSLELDEEGNPIVLEDSELERELKIILFDAKFRFCDEYYSSLYRDSVIDEMVRWLNEDIEGVSKRLLENTELLFHPKKTYGLVSVYDEDGELRTIESEQNLNVKLTIPKRVNVDRELKSEISKTVISTVIKSLSQRTVTLSGIITDLRDILTDDVYGIDVTGLGGDIEVTTMTMEDESQSLSLSKELFVAPDSTIGIRNDISISFIQHSE